jgi:hypothetical protein
LREVEAPTFSDIRLTDGGKVVSLTPRPPFTPRKIPRQIWREYANHTNNVINIINLYNYKYTCGMESKHFNPNLRENGDKINPHATVQKLTPWF